VTLTFPAGSVFADAGGLNGIRFPVARSWPCFEVRQKILDLLDNMLFDRF
jgi:hypothetical protein